MPTNAKTSTKDRGRIIWKEVRNEYKFAKVKLDDASILQSSKVT